MKVHLHLREGVTAAGLTSTLAREIRAGQHKAWELVRARPLTIRHKGRFKSVVTVKPAARRAARLPAGPDLVASMTGKDAGFVLRYFVGLVAMKLGAQVKGLYVPVDEA
ncbi:MAG TPA: hypothetical protein VL244_15275 [Alphaproteobacteria bacterium]|nr:hypothetical protein [Alphaproteobacteria bacterium]